VPPTTSEREIFKTKTPENLRELNPKKNPKGNPKERKLQKTLGIEPPKIVTPDNVFRLQTDRLVGRQTIPIYDMEAVVGLVPLFADNCYQYG